MRPSCSASPVEDMAGFEREGARSDSDQAISDQSEREGAFKPPETKPRTLRERPATPCARSANRCDLGEFDSLQIAVRTWMLAGRGLSEVEEELIDPARLSADEKAVLWLLAWSMLPPSRQRAEVEAHIERLSTRASLTTTTTLSPPSDPATRQRRPRPSRRDDQGHVASAVLVRRRPPPPPVAWGGS